MKKLLAIDTSTDLASVALLVNGVIISEEEGSQKTHAQILLPMIERLLSKTELSLAQLDAIVFGCGPGSFTGLRIACSVAKGLAYAHDLPLIPISSLAAIAWAARQSLQDNDALVLSVLDARMNELYWSVYSDLSYQSTEYVNKPEDIIIPTVEKALVLAGVGIDSYWERFPQVIQTQLDNKLTLFPKASTMLEMAMVLDLQSVTSAQAKPVYVRNQVTQGTSHG